MKCKIKILFFKDPSSRNPGVYKYVDDLIKWWTNSQYYHVGMYIDGVWIAANTEGVRMYNDIDIIAEYDEYETVLDLTDKQYTDLIEWCVSKNNSDYDYLGILLSTIVPARIDNPNKWFCSELVTKILQLMLVKETYNLTPNMVTPGRLAKLLGVE